MNSKYASKSSSKLCSFWIQYFSEDLKDIWVSSTTYDLSWTASSGDRLLLMPTYWFIIFPMIYILKMTNYGNF